MSKTRGNNKIWIGCDPGINGAVGVIGDDFIECFKLPTVKYVLGNKKTRNKINTYQLINMLKPLLARGNPKVLIEKVGSRPGEGSLGAFNFGYASGLLFGVFTALTGEEPSLVLPAKWKKSYGLRLESKAVRLLRDTKSSKASIKYEMKRASRQLSATMFPTIADKFKRVCDHDIAESMLLAAYLRDVSTDQ